MRPWGASLCWEGASLPPTATGVDPLQFPPEITARALWVAPCPLSALPSPRVSLPMGRNSDQHHCMWKQTPGSSCSSTARLDGNFSAYFKARHKVNQNKLWVYFGLWQSCCYGLALPAGCPRQGLTLSVPCSAEQGGNVFIPNLEHLSHGGPAPSPTEPSTAKSPGLTCHHQLQGCFNVP